MERAVLKLERHHSAAIALLIGDQIKGEEFHEEVGSRSQRLTIKRVQDRVAGAIGRRAGTLRGTLAKMRRHATERPLINLALFGPRERHAPVFKLVHRGRSVTAEIFDSVLIARASPTP